MSRSAVGYSLKSVPLSRGYHRATSHEAPAKAPLQAVQPDHDPDDDPEKPGINHALDIARSLHGFAKSAKIVALAGLTGKQDVSDFIERVGRDIAKSELERLAAEAPEYGAGAADQTTANSSGGSSEASSDEAKPSRFHKLRQAFQATDSQVFTDQLGEPWATVIREDHAENLALKTGRIYWVTEVKESRPTIQCPN
ncbi:MAG: hypothetical protein AB1646_09670 [Thermodesulfobacteriota bacterium]